VSTKRKAELPPALDPLLTDADIARIYNVNPGTPKEWRRRSSESRRFGPPWIEIENGGSRKLIRYRQSAVSAHIEGKAA
jgi:transposase-like protein